jgi:hypothetical protein
MKLDYGLCLEWGICSETELYIHWLHAVSFVSALFLKSYCFASDCHYVFNVLFTWLYEIKYNLDTLQTYDSSYDG